MKNMEQIQYEIQEMLRTVYDVALRIFSYSTQPESTKMTEVVHGYASALVNAWQKSFGSNHVMSVTAVKYRLKKIVTDYHNQVYVKANRKPRKKKAVEDQSQKESKESMRPLNNIDILYKSRYPTYLE